MRWISDYHNATISAAMKFKAITLLLLLTATSAFGETQVQDSKPSVSCNELVEGCFTKSEAERAQCFRSASKNSLCNGSPLGQLSLKRWAMTPSKTETDAAQPSLLHPKLVDLNCLSNFDNEWSSALLNGSLTPAILKQLDSKLASCVSKGADELLRP